MKKIKSHKRHVTWTAICLAMVLFASMTLSGCAIFDKVNFSEKYLIGVSFGGSGWGEFYECLDCKLIVCRDGSLEIYLPEVEGYSVKGYALGQTMTLTPEQYQAIEQGVDLKKLYSMKIESEEDVCDGGTYYLYIYGEDDEVLKAVGGYEPKSKKFFEMRSAVLDNIPLDEVREIRKNYVDKLREEAGE